MVDFLVHRRLNSAGPLGGPPASQFPDPTHGGTVAYANPPGFVHTSYRLLSPDGNNTAQAPDLALWTTHREWFWPRDRAVYGQLCWSNASLQRFIIANLRLQLAQQPDATIVSVSQNDNTLACQDPAELAQNVAEGTPGGALFRAVRRGDALRFALCREAREGVRLEERMFERVSLALELVELQDAC